MLAFVGEFDLALLGVGGLPSISFAGEFKENNGTTVLLFIGALLLLLLLKDDFLRAGTLRCAGDKDDADDGEFTVRGRNGEPGSRG